MSSASTLPARLRRSRHISWFGHAGAVYLFHDLYGYIMEMSPDIALMIEAFSDGVDTEETIAYYQGKLGDGNPREFVDILAGHAVLVDPAEDEIEGIWAFVPMKGKWNVWRRRDDRLTLWTAWGDRPIQQLFLDPDETKIWDAFDGNKRLIELRHHHDNAKIVGLVRRLVHSDVQALKLSMMPWSAYAKRPGMAPAYLASTMPYARWEPGTAVPGTRPTAEVSPTAYYRDEVADADAQFDHQETTLSHLLRQPHPALDGKTYGQRLGERLLARGLVPERPDGRLRVLEIGGGLGYVAKDLQATLAAAGHAVDYTIVELAPALAAAQQQRLGADGARWVMGDVLAVDLPDAGFDLILSNEMAGDLPAREITRADLGLAPDQGTADPVKVRALSPIAADTRVNLDDAPAATYLMTGAFEMVARICRWLAPGGTALVTEFGDLGAWPRLSTHLDHPELSTHFGQLQQVARGLAVNVTIEFVIDLLEVDREQKGLATTRSYFRALRALCADAGIDLAKIGYTPALLAEAVAGKLDLGTIGELRWDRIEDRLMGLVPHEFKALVIRQPAL